MKRTFVRTRNGTRRWALALASVLLSACSATPAPQASSQEQASRPEFTEVERAEVLALVDGSPAAEAPTFDILSPPEPSQPNPVAEPVNMLALGEPPSEVHRQLDSLRSDIEAGKLAPSRARLSRWIPTLQKSGSVDEILTATSLLGRAYDRSGMPAAAGREYAAVVSRWEEDKKLSAIPAEHNGARFARMAHALSATGEALFFQAERVSEAASALTPPTAPRSRYGPPAKPLKDMTPQEFEREMERRKADNETFQRYVNTSLKGWIESKRQRIEDAEKAYMRLMDLHPGPPPFWLVAAGSRVGTLWSDFANDFAKVPIPAWMSQDPELVRVYRDNLEQAVEPIRQRARAAFETCQQAAANYRVESEAARACDSWLQAHPAP